MDLQGLAIRLKRFFLRAQFFEDTPQSRPRPEMARLKPQRLIHVAQGFGHILFHQKDRCPPVIGFGIVRLDGDHPVIEFMCKLKLAGRLGRDGALHDEVGSRRSAFQPCRPDVERRAVCRFLAGGILQLLEHLVARPIGGAADRDKSCDEKRFQHALEYECRCGLGKARLRRSGGRLQYAFLDKRCFQRLSGREPVCPEAEIARGVDIFLAVIDKKDRGPVGPAHPLMRNVIDRAVRLDQSLGT